MPAGGDGLWQAVLHLQPETVLEQLGPGYEPTSLLAPEAVAAMRAFAAENFTELEYLYREFLTPREIEQVRHDLVTPGAFASIGALQAIADAFGLRVIVADVDTHTSGDPAVVSVRLIRLTRQPWMTGPGVPDGEHYLVAVTGIDRLAPGPVPQPASAAGRLGPALTEEQRTAVWVVWAALLRTGARVDAATLNDPLAFVDAPEEVGPSSATMLTAGLLRPAWRHDPSLPIPAVPRPASVQTALAGLNLSDTAPLWHVWESMLRDGTAATTAEIRERGGYLPPVGGPELHPRHAATRDAQTSPRQPAPGLYREHPHAPDRARPGHGGDLEEAAELAAWTVFLPAAAAERVNRLLPASVRLPVTSIYLAAMPELTPQEVIEFRSWVHGLVDPAERVRILDLLPVPAPIGEGFAALPPQHRLADADVGARIWRILARGPRSLEQILTADPTLTPHDTATTLAAMQAAEFTQILGPAGIAPVYALRRPSWLTDGQLIAAIAASLYDMLRTAPPVVRHAVFAGFGLGYGLPPLSAATRVALAREGLDVAHAWLAMAWMAANMLPVTAEQLQDSIGFASTELAEQVLNTLVRTGDVRAMDWPGVRAYTLQQPEDLPALERAESDAWASDLPALEPAESEAWAWTAAGASPQLRDLLRVRLGGHDGLAPLPATRHSRLGRITDVEPSVLRITWTALLLSPAPATVEALQAATLLSPELIEIHLSALQREHLASAPAQASTPQAPMLFVGHGPAGLTADELAVQNAWVATLPDDVRDTVAGNLRPIGERPAGPPPIPPLITVTPQIRRGRPVPAADPAAEPWYFTTEQWQTLRAGALIPRDVTAPGRNAALNAVRHLGGEHLLGQIIGALPAAPTEAEINVVILERLADQASREDQGWLRAVLHAAFPGFDTAGFLQNLDEALRDPAGAAAAGVLLPWLLSTTFGFRIPIHDAAGLVEYGDPTHPVVNLIPRPGRPSSTGTGPADVPVHYLTAALDPTQVAPPPLRMPRFPEITAALARAGINEPATGVWTSWQELILAGSGTAADIQTHGSFPDRADTLRHMTAMLAAGMLQPAPGQTPADPSAADENTRYIPALDTTRIPPGLALQFQHWAEALADPAARTRAIRMLAPPLPRPILDAIATVPGLTPRLALQIWRGLPGPDEPGHGLAQIAADHGLDPNQADRILRALTEDAAMLNRDLPDGRPEDTAVFTAWPIGLWTDTSAELAHLVAWDQEQSDPIRFGLGPPADRSVLPPVPAVAHARLVRALAGHPEGPDLPTARLLLYHVYTENWPQTLADTAALLHGVDPDHAVHLAAALRDAGLLRPVATPGIDPNPEDQQFLGAVPPGTTAQDYAELRNWLAVSGYDIATFALHTLVLFGAYDIPPVPTPARQILDHIPNVQVELALALYRILLLAGRRLDVRGVRQAARAQGVYLEDMYLDVNGTALDVHLLGLGQAELVSVVRRDGEWTFEAHAHLRATGTVILALGAWLVRVLGSLPDPNRVFGLNPQPQVMGAPEEVMGAPEEILTRLTAHGLDQNDRPFVGAVLDWLLPARAPHTAEEIAGGLPDLSPERRTAILAALTAADLVQTSHADNGEEQYLLRPLHLGSVLDIEQMAQRARSLRSAAAQTAALTRLGLPALIPPLTGPPAQALARTLVTLSLTWRVALDPLQALRVYGTLLGAGRPQTTDEITATHAMENTQRYADALVASGLAEAVIVDGERAYRGLLGPLSEPLRLAMIAFADAVHTVDAVAAARIRALPALAPPAPPAPLTAAAHAELTAAGIDTEDAETILGLALRTGQVDVHTIRTELGLSNDQAALTLALAMTRARALGRLVVHIDPDDGGDGDQTFAPDLSALSRQYFTDLAAWATALPQAADRERVAARLRLADPAARIPSTQDLLDSGLLTETNDPGLYELGTPYPTGEQRADLQAWVRAQPNLTNQIVVSYQLMPVLPPELTGPIEAEAVDIGVHPGLLVMTWALLAAGNQLDAADTVAAAFYRRNETRAVIDALTRLGLITRVEQREAPGSHAAERAERRRIPGLPDGTIYEHLFPAGLAADAADALHTWINGLPRASLATLEPDGTWHRPAFARPVQALLFAGSTLFTDPGNALTSPDRFDAFRRAQPAFWTQNARTLIAEERRYLLAEAETLLAHHGAEDPYTHPTTRFTEASHDYAQRILTAWNQQGTIPEAPDPAHEHALGQIEVMFVAHGHLTAQQTAIHLGTPIGGHTLRTPGNPETWVPPPWTPPHSAW